MNAINLNTFTKNVQFIRLKDYNLNQKNQVLY